jgi:hypothetical protein
MSTAVLPEQPTEVIEPVDPPEVVREKAGVDRVVRLQDEYQQKLRLLRVERPNPVADRRWVRERARPLVIAAERLARYASGLIENARLPQIDKIELQLRNAELEAELIEARHLIG